MGGCLRAPKSWFLGTLERPCCPPQLQSAGVFMAASAGLFRAALTSEFLQREHTFPQQSCLLACRRILRVGSAPPRTAAVGHRLGWACFDGSARAAVDTESCCTSGSMGVWSRCFFSFKSDLATEVLDAMRGEEQSKESFCDKDLTGLELFSFRGRFGLSREQLSVAVVPFCYSVVSSGQCE